ncbi:hypothetical protein O3G_MSEX011135 [Manduca sexta]|uniref:C2H2-type domain-containing protein n=1 Tax=Manduca sexta TaxID=7130 RepID=A0A921ZKA7_MANSE|nr:hypothetical protein O3G_MSEX011135 [Manduca sexta]KAG6458948.1 hypothetical protein O3G_MSEX011135 [Manduca sexta]KAG6458949.1 hypothetical protein O3G_MSEX011135 [Manduca sexta]KAG6458950.1 hypothetical protein O3G_MSEX011135 [Manduca sexta]KAG6458951.1 hypothetical protein O3G_MSEX011135 [Manduca sexta]
MLYYIIILYDYTLFIYAQHYVSCIVIYVFCNNVYVFRMKMENLLKCEQVLINLYAKVEQRDTQPTAKQKSGETDSSRMDSNSQLEIVRNKLKRVIKIQDGADTLPEIVRASDVEDICMRGSVEPALFQRRPHRKSPTLSDVSSSSQEKKKSPEQNSKRKYTRVLYSPEPSTRTRPTNQETSLDPVLFSRRSPKKSSSHSKKDSKKASSTKTSSKKTKDLNITLNVPEESLNSLNTKDILSRIITCNDNDVDIETLRGLRTQILSELKQTGANDDISDLILKSYAEKKTVKPKEEIEEGELSDSESEAIESIYGSLVLVEKDKTKSEVKSIQESNQPRKIQICLVINSKESESSNKTTLNQIQNTIDDECDLEMFIDTESKKIEPKSEQFPKEEKAKSTIDTINDSTADVLVIDDDDPVEIKQESQNIKKTDTKKNDDKDIIGTATKDDKVVDKKRVSEANKDVTSKKTSDKIVHNKEANLIIKDVVNKKTSDKLIEKDETIENKDIKSKEKSEDVFNKKYDCEKTNDGSPDKIKDNNTKSDSSLLFKANFYKPILEEENAGSPDSSVVNQKDNSILPLETSKSLCTDISKIINKNECVEIPLLNEPIISKKPIEKDIDSQIDILQALKNEILSDNIMPTSRLDVVTPPLHQPKLTKMSHDQGLMPKKRISIEKYKEKTTPVTLSLFPSGTLKSPLRDDCVKKQSLKLTEKECERFNFPAKLDINDEVSSEDEVRKGSDMTIDEIYSNFAPKSPDHEDTRFIGKTQPVIIPIDPVKASIVNVKADVDMRTLLPLLSPKETSVAGNTTPSSSTFQKSKDLNKQEMKISKSTTFPSNNFGPNMTPRSFEVNQLSDFNTTNSPRQHVYAPSFSLCDSRDATERSVLNDVSSPLDSEINIGMRTSRRNDNDHDSRGNISHADKHSDRSSVSKNDDSMQGHEPMTPLPVFGWSESLSTPNSFAMSEGPKPLMNFGRLDRPTTPNHPFGRNDCPTTPIHPFGRSDCPTTPIHPFGRSDCPTTPIHPFGRSDCPTTPIHPFGRSDCPTTPIHPFGRSDCPTTPIHPFGQSDCPSTPSHPFGRSDIPPASSHMFGRTDCPATPSHPFGRMDCLPTPNNPFVRMDFPVAQSQTFGMSDCPTTPSHPFGRSDCPRTPNHPFGISECPNTPSHHFGHVDGSTTPNYSFSRADQTQNTSINQQYSKDPRLNRRSESRPQRDERDNRNYSNRRFNTGSYYQTPNRSYGRSESYRNYDRDDGRDRERSRSTSQNEKSFECARSKENRGYVSDKRGSYYDYRSRRGERDPDDIYRRDKSVGRDQGTQENLPSRSRAHSVSKNDNKEKENDNRLSVKSHAGRSFTIDTSVNSTFQDILKKKGLDVVDQSFDSRRQRASSLGRSDSCFDADRTKMQFADDSKYRSKTYKRASSVGKDLLCDKNDSYEKVKTDLKNYQKNLISQNEKQPVTKTLISEDNKVEKKYTDSTKHKSVPSTTKTSKQAYSPKKNYRDPRMRRDYEDKNSYRSSGHSYDKKKHGINYSNDNLAKGAVLGSGYGVKNYKIPKIKRVINDDEVKQVEEKNVPVERTVNKVDSKAIISKKQYLNDEQNTALEESPGRRITRSLKKDKTADTSTKRDGFEVRKSKRVVIYDSSSDSDLESKNKDSVDSDIQSNAAKEPSKLEYFETNKNEQTAKDSTTFDNQSLFDKFVSDPVIDNINALIADLDHHIDNSTTKESENLNKDIDMDLGSTDNSEEISLSKELTLDSTKKDITAQTNVVEESIKNDMQEKVVSCVNTSSNTSLSNLDATNNEMPIIQETKDININKSQDDDHKISKLDSEIPSDDKIVADINKMNTNNDAIVSTTDNGKDINNTALEDEKVKPVENLDVNYETSAADSTNEVTIGKTKEQNLPDSTNDMHNEMNSLVSSSLSSAETKDFVDPNLSQDPVPPLDSIGSLLSILQDKSKIHQLLNMLGEQSGDNDKIKRKLEKLSEIASDDEEEVSEQTVNKTEISHVTNKKSVSEISKAVVDEKTSLLISYNDQADNKIDSEEPAIHDAESNEKNVGDTLNRESDDQVMTKDSKDLKDETETVLIKKGKGPRKGKGKFAKAKKTQRTTRAGTGVVTKKPTIKKPSRELLKLREDIKEMFLTDEMLNSTGIRMCRLAKLVDEKSTNRKEETTPSEPKPVVVLEKFKNKNKTEESLVTDKITKKKSLQKVKRKVSSYDDNTTNEECSTSPSKSKLLLKNNSVPIKDKSKAKASKQEDIDPYQFEVDCVDTSTPKGSDSEEASDDEINSLGSSKSYGSSELLADLKKAKPKRRGKSWQTGVIKTKSKKKKQAKPAEKTSDIGSLNKRSNIVIPDSQCFVDKFYCFEKNVTSYSCRLCEYNGEDIVLHYKKQHPHTEIPLSRMNPGIAKEAIEQCQEVNFPAISKISTDRYVCRFCFKEFSKNKAVLETFFWHVVSMHTGEYKQTCSECANETCHFTLDIPPPPKDNTGQLIGYLCGKCNFTQVSLENLKTHVIGRHNDEQTDVYTINLAAMTKKMLKTLAKHQATIAPRVLRSSHSNRSISESTDEQKNDETDEIADTSAVSELASEKEEKTITVKTEKKSNITSMQSKITFENEENLPLPSNMEVNFGSVEIKKETIELPVTDPPTRVSDPVEPDVTEASKTQNDTTLPDDIMLHAHFKICYKKSGAKEYVCCINGNDNHYKTTLLISLKKHVQTKHNERWDGYCILCKVIVTTQGVHNFKDCLHHFLDKHMGEFPELEVPTEVLSTPTESLNNDLPSNSSNITDVSKPYINVRPLNQLISSRLETDIREDSPVQFPKIQSVVSLGGQVGLSSASPSYPSVLSTEVQEDKQYRYEDWQAEIMSKKHRVVLNAMMAEQKLVKVFKCTGKFCSFTTDDAEFALLHATTHQRIGGEGALNCSYCDFDASHNGIDLVMHVFQAHGNCSYSCKLCFYRAASSQLVSSHISRLHSERQSFDAILHTNTMTATAKDDNLMSREAAVPSYVCGHSSSEDGAGGCNFRTYTPTQFAEHLMRHQAPYPCSICSIAVQSPSELVHHMKIHGLRLYQCTSCVFGADNEPEMLAHASSRHPDKLPQAYLRVVTNKDGSSEIRVLPRAILNKLKVPFRDVTSKDNDNPVREAERSLALEKLIGHTEAMTSIEPIESTTDENNDDVSADPGIIEDSEVLLTENMEHDVMAPPALLPHSSPRPNELEITEDLKHKSEDNSVSSIKTEPGVETKNISSDTVVYCLDSDDDEPKSRVIDISDDDHTSAPTTAKSSQLEVPREYKKVPLDSLFKCPKCYIFVRNVTGFKRHLFTCVGTKPFTLGVVQCPHGICNTHLGSIAEIAEHYLKNHADRKITIYACGVCKEKFRSATLTKKHMKTTHKSFNFAANAPISIEGDNRVYTINESAQRATQKRKSSSDSSKLKRYGPQDIDQLPINPILDSLVYCALCEFNTKVRLNLVRHLQLHAEQQPVPDTAPVNPVPHLESNERHFDKMVNLASSSIINRAQEKPTRSDLPPVSLLVPDASRYPKYVPDRLRYTCGAKSCSYISLDEVMLRIHWETLHSNSNDYLCVHCPPHQHTDMNKPLSAVRIIGHLKMHEENLYACSSCNFYHCKRAILEKHLSKCPNDPKEAQVMVVREGGVTPVPVPTPPATVSASAPTMDLKPWQCGLCSFKSMLRPEVTEHCFKIHQSKMQYKCNYCPFRTSAVENVTKHQANAHSNKAGDVFYYYYREGSIPDDDDGTPLWVKQKQKSAAAEPVVKAEIPEPSTSQSAVDPVTPVVPVDLNIVKQEVEDLELSEIDKADDDLCKKFGEYCEPKGVKYKCPLCTAVVEDTAEAMQSHLYEELKYRKWACTVCSYKAFHKTGLNEHIKSEHRRHFQEPVELPTDKNVEQWVAGLIEHQTSLIEKAKQNPPVEDKPSTSKGVTDEANLEELKQAFGSFGSPRDSLLCCPKCSCTLKDEAAMKEHLESELNKIRWCCSICTFMSQTYHEAQFHCKSQHSGASASPREALRDPARRAAWVRAVLRHQLRELTHEPAHEPVHESPDESAREPAHEPMHESTTEAAQEPTKASATTLIDTPTADSDDNSLLVVRYEERVSSTADLSKRKRSAPVDSDEEKLVIDESEPVKKAKSQPKTCPHCDFKTKWTNALREHILRHYNLKPFKCKYCDYMGYRPSVLKHTRAEHPKERVCMESTQIPSEPPQVIDLPKHHMKKSSIQDDIAKQICLHCEKLVSDKDMDTHIHENTVTEFGKKGEVVVKCCICLELRLDAQSLQDHHNLCHPGVPINYAFFKLHCDSRECYYCGHCGLRFSYLRDLRSHHRATHSGVQMKYTAAHPGTAIVHDDSAKRKNDDESVEPSPKRVARKSTTKLPFNAVAKKSTTKLPHSVSDADKEYTFYGTKASSLNEYANVTTLMPFCNTLVPFTVQKLSEIIKIEPVVLVDNNVQ